MNIINLNLESQKQMPEILDAFIEVYGKKNEFLVRENTNKGIYTKYISSDAALKYYEFLKTCKANELSIKYLKRIGVLDSHYQLRKSYQRFPKKIANLLNQYLGSTNTTYIFTGEVRDNYAICSFLEEQKEEDKHNGYHQFTKEEQQIAFLNNLRKNKKPLINLDNYKEFKKTEEYTELSKKIMSYLQIFLELNEEFFIYLKEIKHFKDFYNSEKEKQRMLYQLKMLKIYKYIKDSIPERIQEKLEEKFPDIKERVNFLLNFDSKDESSIESFSTEANERLNNPNISKNEKNSILISRIIFFQNLGIDIDIFSYNKYNEIIKREDIKAIIPDEELANEIIFYKNSERQDYAKECICSNPYFDKSVDTITNRLISENGPTYYSFKNKIEDALYEKITSENSCIFHVTVSETDKEDKIFTILLHLINETDAAQVDFTFLHELTHTIESNNKDSILKSGFDINSDEESRNPYLNKCRLFERLNETITDIIATLVRKKLMKKGIYLIESKKLTDTEFVRNRNTDNILKIMLYPLFDKVKQELLDARITGEIESFTTLIGLQNFLDLNDAINKVDYLIQKEDLKKKLKSKNYQDPTVIEYYNQLTRVKIIYEDIDNRLLEQNKTNSKEYKKSL